MCIKNRGMNNTRTCLLGSELINQNYNPNNMYEFRGNEKVVVIFHQKL